MDDEFFFFLLANQIRSIKIRMKMKMIKIKFTSLKMFIPMGTSQWNPHTFFPRFYITFCVNTFALKILFGNLQWVSLLFRYYAAPLLQFTAIANSNNKKLTQLLHTNLLRVNVLSRVKCHMVTLTCENTDYWSSNFLNENLVFLMQFLKHKNKIEKK